jgi:hypothetical protein
MNINSKHPNFFVIGAAKCGTTTLYDFLEQHPDVYMSPIKEPHHFSKDIVMENFSTEYKHYLKTRNVNLNEYLQSDLSRKIWEWYISDYNQYLQLFKNVNSEKAIGEISNGYLFSEVAAKEIYATYPNAKIIMILRNPVERAYSHYLANVRDGRTTLGFRDEIIDDEKKTRKGWCISHCYVEMGMYHDQIKRFIDVFPSSQIKIYLNDDLKKSASVVGKDLLSFLQVNLNATIDYSKKQNEARLPKSAGIIKLITQTGLKRKIFRALPKKMQEKVKPLFFKEGNIPKISKEDHQWLLEKYKSDIEKTQNLIGRDLSDWLK